MPEVFLPTVQKNSSSGGATTPPPPPPMGKRLVIDPITRIEGHLRLEVKIENGIVTDAWSAGTMWRGIELVLRDRDPRDAWIFAQRICGVCTTVHAISSVRAVENALGITIPDNARLIRNLIEGALYIHDHVMHFYHLHALDWVDVVNALNADPAAASTAQKSLSPWPNNSTSYFQTIKNRLQNFVNSGQLGIFANGYWGHPAYKLSPEANLIAVAHYLEALEWQHSYAKLMALLGGKNPHPQTYLVGGMAAPVDKTNSAAVTPQDIAQMRTLTTQARDLVNQVYIPDLLLVASQYPEWASLGGGYGNFLSIGDFPDDTRDTSQDPSSLWLPRGVIYNKDISHAPQALDHNLIQEYITHSWFSYPEGDAAGKHPSQGVTQPNFTGPNPPYDYLDVDGKYSWLKTPRYNNTPVEVGPLARVLVAYAAGHARIRQLVDTVLSTLSLGPDALFSTLGRTAARGIETVAIAEQMDVWLNQLEANINANNLQIHNASKWDPSTWPADMIGWGSTEAPRGALGHWVHVQNGKISNYQMIVATQWNASPRDAQGQRGIYEQALLGIPVQDPNKPVEILRAIHSFDPCMACSVHIVDGKRRELTSFVVEAF